MTSAIGDRFELPVRIHKVFSKRALGSPSRLSLRKSRPCNYSRNRRRFWPG